VLSLVTEGYPADVLLHAAKGADLLVLGRRGHGGVTSVLLGSVSLHCVLHAPLPGPGAAGADVSGSEREGHVEERANRILSDERAATAYAAFVEAQLRGRGWPNLRARLRELARILAIVAVALASAGTFFNLAADPPRG
jgi:hypothetical protein